LPLNIQNALQDEDNTLVLSVVSMWEMQIKAQIGRLHLPVPVKEFVAVKQATNNIQTLPILARHVWTLNSLPLHHRDPFDRLLLAQAVTEKVHFVSIDAVMTQYPVSLLTE
jgi:PIN domain nuclease of toxin-antitoxin system